MFMPQIPPRKVDACINRLTSINEMINPQRDSNCLVGFIEELTTLKNDINAYSGSTDINKQPLLEHIEMLFQKIQRSLHQQPQRPIQSFVFIRVTYNAGYGNTIEIRGSEAVALSWKRGKPLFCEDATHWRIVVMANSPFEFKFVLRKENRECTWEQLPNNGNRIFDANICTIAPVFPGHVPGQG